MKIAIIIYKMMSIIMIACCIALAIFSFTIMIDLKDVIIPVIASTIFVLLVIKSRKQDKKLKKLLLNLYGSHGFVVLTVIQVIIVFDVKFQTAIAIILIAFLMMTMMILILRYFFKKMGAFNAEN